MVRSVLPLPSSPPVAFYNVVIDHWICCSCLGEGPGDPHMEAQTAARAGSQVLIQAH